MCVCVYTFHLQTVLDATAIGGSLRFLQLFISHIGARDTERRRSRGYDWQWQLLLLVVVLKKNGDEGEEQNRAG